MGASSSGDGLSCTSWPLIFHRRQLKIEQRYPVRFKQLLTPNSGGNGAFKGGDGQTVEFQYIGKKPGSSLLSRKNKIPASGIAGGEDGVRGRLELNGDPIDPKLQHVVNPGDYIYTRDSRRWWLWKSFFKRLNKAAIHKNSRSTFNRQPVT